MCAPEMDFKLGSQSQISGGTSGVDGEAHTAKARTKNVKELQVAVMQWELTLC